MMTENQPNRTLPDGLRRAFQEMATLMRASDCIVLITDAAGIICEITEAKHITPHASTQAIGQPLSYLTLPAWRDRIDAFFRLSSAQPLHEFTYPRAEQPPGWFKQTVTPYTFNDANYHLILLQDVTHYKMAMEKEHKLERRNQALIGALPDAMFVLNRAGVFTEMHLPSGDPQPYAALSAGMNLFDAVLPDDVLEEARNLLELTFAIGASQAFEYTLEQGGISMQYETRLVAINDEEALALVRDITPIKLIQDELSRHIDDLTIMQQVDSELAATLNVNTVIPLALDAMMRLGKADAGFIALKDQEERVQVDYIFGAFDMDEVQRAITADQGIFSRVMRTQLPELVPDVRHDADYVALRQTTQAAIAIPLASRERIIGVVNLETRFPERFTADTFQFLRLITGRIAIMIDNARLHQQTESQVEELQRLYNEVSKLEQLKTDMIRIASHDLKNPLSAIMGYVEMLHWDLDETLTESQMDYLNNVDMAARQMRRIATGILSLERIQEMAERQTDVTFDFVASVKQAIDEQRPNLVQKQHDLQLQMPDEALPIVGDVLQMGEALNNLISNAIKYTPEAGQITVIVVPDDDHVIFRIEDNGFGIPKEQQKELFRPFFRARTTETDLIEGTGLGLHLVKNIVERHDGEMIFKSVYGEGSTFGFRLPRSL